MAKLDQGLWHELMGYLRQHHEPICRQWFEQLTPVELDGGLLQIRTTNAVQRNYLQKRCLEPFTEAAQNVTGQLVGVQFVNDHGVLTPEAAEQSEPSPDPAQAQRSIETRPETQDHPQTTPGRSLNPAGPGWSTIDSAPPPTSSKPTQPAAKQARPAKPPRRVSTGTSLGTPVAPGPGAGHPLGHDEDEMVLSPDYCFEQFITGPNNQLAYAASVAVANQPGTTYNPLFIHGGVGLGKTHLLQAICQQILNQDPSTSILYVSCDGFMNQFIECVQSGQMNQFRHRYRHVNMLVIDDIHFLGSGERERSQEEFFHTFNELYQSNRQIVISSDAPPSQIPQLEERLVSRFNWGLVAPVSKPSYETRVAILRSKAALRAMAVPDEVVDHIARTIDANARELEGAITTLQAHASVRGRPIDADLAREALGEPSAQPQTNRVTLDHIIDEVTRYFEIKLSDLQSRRRHKSVTEPRQMCMWLARQRTRFSLEEIGGYFGGRDHTTVMHSIRIVEKRMAQDEPFARQLEHLDNMIQRTGDRASGSG